MLAFQDYVEALKKIGEINIRLKKDNENNSLRIEQFKKDKKELENEVRESEKLIQSFEKPDIIQEKGEDLIRELSKEKNIDIKTDRIKYKQRK